MRYSSHFIAAHDKKDSPRECASIIKKAGVDKILTQCVGCNTKGHDGLYPTRFPVEERLGWESGFRDMIRIGNGLGFNVQVHDNFIMQNVNAPDFDRDYAIIDIRGGSLIHGRWAGGPGLMPILDDARVAGIKAIYDLCVSKFGHLKRLQLVEYRRLSEDAHQTRFSDGTEVTADFEAKELRVNGGNVPCPPALSPQPE